MTPLSQSQDSHLLETRNHLLPLSLALLHVIALPLEQGTTALWAPITTEELRLVGSQNPNVFRIER
jgi:hypothetical protein